MKRTVAAHLTFTVHSRADLVFAVAAARPGPGAQLEESLSFRRDGMVVDDVTEIDDLHGSRLHRFSSDAGELVVEYDATVTGRSEPVPVLPIDLITYLRPSRYAESDALFPTARSEFSGLRGRELLTAVSSWVGAHLSYVPGSSQPTDGARETLLDRRGVCRDYSHLCIALLRALDVPARLVSAYAPGLSPMDFHAVAEAYVDGAWHVIDATALAPRQSLLRIGTGRDAADTAFLTNFRGEVTVKNMDIMAVVDDLPYDDVREFVSLG